MDVFQCGVNETIQMLELLRQCKLPKLLLMYFSFLWLFLQFIRILRLASTDPYDKTEKLKVVWDNFIFDWRTGNQIIA